MNTPQPTTPALPLDLAVLRHAVRAALDNDTAEIEQWQIQPAGASRGAATAGVYRLSGLARRGHELLTWAVMLKIIQPAASDFNPAVREMDHPLFWKREALVYESGLLDDLPGGIGAPRCLALETRPDESCWLWLAEVQDSFSEQWPLTQYRRAATILGRFNGAYLAGQPMPTAPWLGSPGTMSGLLQAFSYVQDFVRDAATWQHPLLRAAFPVPIADRLQRLWQERQPLIEGLDRLPQTFCHKDAFRRNMFAPQSQTEDDRSRLVLIDWAYVGRGEIGLDIADLFGASYSTFSVASTNLQALDEAIFEGYLAGLRQAGWQGEARLARFGFAAAASLKYGNLLFWLGDLADAQRYAAWEELSGRSIDVFVQHKAGLVYYLLDLADEARDLLSVI